MAAAEAEAEEESKPETQRRREEEMREGSGPQFWCGNREGGGEGLLLYV